MISVPSNNKGKHACQRVFSALFALFALACASKPASQKPKITRKSIAGRCFAVLPEQKCVQTRKGPQRILAVLSRALTQYGRISARQNRVCPCHSMVPNQRQRRTPWTRMKRPWRPRCSTICALSLIHIFRRGFPQLLHRRCGDPGQGAGGGSGLCRPPDQQGQSGHHRPRTGSQQDRCLLYTSRCV